jgi:hypothetical protein
MGLVADCEHAKLNGGTQNATQQILTNWNTVSLLYRSTFNISLEIIELQIQDSKYVTLSHIHTQKENRLIDD